MTAQTYEQATALLIAMECGGNLDRYLSAYQDGGGIWTIGCGSTFMPAGRRVRRGDVLTRAAALALLDRQIETWGRVMTQTIKAKLTDAQGAVLTSFIHQEGPNALPGSVLADMLNAGLSVRAAGQLNGWVIGRQNGVRQLLIGLMRRQETQRRMMLGAPLEPTRTEVWSLGYATLRPLYDAACADAAAYRRSPPPHPQPADADALMAAEQAGTLHIAGA